MERLNKRFPRKLTRETNETLESLNAIIRFTMERREYIFQRSTCDTSKSNRRASNFRWFLPASSVRLVVFPGNCKRYPSSLVVACSARLDKLVGFSARVSRDPAQSRFGKKQVNSPRNNVTTTIPANGRLSLSLSLFLKLHG